MADVLYLISDEQILDLAYFLAHVRCPQAEPEEQNGDQYDPTVRFSASTADCDLTAPTTVFVDCGTVTTDPSSEPSSWSGK
jgi:hypothetical protein